MSSHSHRNRAGRQQLAGSSAVLLAAVCFGTLGPASRFAYEAGLEPIVLVAWRAWIGAVGLAIFVPLVARSVVGRSMVGPLDGRRIPLRQGLSLLAAGGAGLTLNLAIFTAFNLGSIAVVLLGFYTYPAFVAVASSLLFGERLGVAKLGALGLALAGMVLVVAGPSLGGGTLAIRPEGLALSLLAALSETVYLLLNRWGHPSVPSAYASLGLLAIGALGFSGIAIVLGRAGALLLPFEDAHLLPLMVFMGIIGAGIPTTLNLIGTRWIGPTRTAILALAEPVVGVGLAALLLAERLEPVQVAGGVLIILAAALLQRSPEPTPTVPEPDRRRPSEQGVKEWRRSR